MKKFITVVTCIVLLLSCLSVVAIAANYDPATDPIITLSYIEKKLIPDIMKQVDNKINELKASVGGTYIVIELKKGETLLAKNDGTEVILRSGTAVVMAPLKNQGISNVTAGNDTLLNAPLIKNNLYIIPRADGRGVKATADCFFMVRGTYSVENITTPAPMPVPTPTPTPAPTPTTSVTPTTSPIFG